MRENKFFTVGLLILFIVQLAIPMYTVHRHRSTYDNGTIHRLKCRPVDPEDPFRGRYLAIDYEANSIIVPYNESLLNAKKLYISLHKGENGYSSFRQVSTRRPNNLDYFVSKVSNTYSTNGNETLRITLELPISRYYMNEYLAPEAEEKYRTATRDGSEVYAEVSVGNGNIVLRGIYIDGLLIDDFVRQATQ